MDIPPSTDTPPGDAGPSAAREASAVDEYLADGIGFITRCARTYGDVVPLPFHVGRRMFYVVSDPATVLEVLSRRAASFRKGHSYRRARAAIGEGLFTADGEVHRRHRQLATPSFRAEEIRRYGERMIDMVTDVVSGWADGSTLDLSGEMSRVTLTVVARTLFGTDLNDRAPHLAGMLVELLELLHGRTRAIEVGHAHVEPAELERFARLRASFDETVFAMIRERRRSGAHGDDLMGRLLGASDEGVGGFDDYELRDEVVTLLISGHDTTGVTLSFALWLLASRPDVRDAAEAEVDRVLADGPLTLDVIPRLTLLGQIFDETLRLYPPVWMLAREALEDVELPALTVRKGDSVGVSLFVLHRDPRWWPDPDAFRPERFAPGAPPPAPGTYLPFGTGNRACIGRSFAEVEAILVLAAVLRAVRLEIDTTHPPRLVPYMLLRPADGILARVRRRAPGR